MEHTFLTEINIRKVRHLSDIKIPLSSEERKNLVLTGKNGSGKTSVLDCLVTHLEYIVSDNFRTEEEMRKSLNFYNNNLKKYDDSEEGRREKERVKDSISYHERQLRYWLDGCTVLCTSFTKLREKYKQGQFIIAAYGDKREMEITLYKNIEKITLKPIYGIKDKPSKELGKYLVDLKSTQAFAQAKGDKERANQIQQWFDRFENILQKVYKDKSLKLDFDIDTFQFSILIQGRDPFTFNTMSMGYAAVFDIIGDLIMRMESKHNYDLEGLVLIDEIETHLHVELQKDIMPILIELFPNIQFILTTHSPFILNSVENAVVYDLEEKLLVDEGLTNLPYEGIVEGYFKVDLFSQELRNKFEEYKRFVQRTDLSDIDYARIVELEDYLDEVPDYLSLDFAEEYSRLKMEFNSRG